MNPIDLHSGTVRKHNNVILIKTIYKDFDRIPDILFIGESKLILLNEWFNHRINAGLLIETYYRKSITNNDISYLYYYSTNSNTVKKLNIGNKFFIIQNHEGNNYLKLV